ncbi:hypothetical protein TWF281_009730 [Arthrobotrys megalospora]
MPVEIVQSIAQDLPRGDQVNLARCGRLMFKIVAPILYHTMTIYFRDDKNTTDFGSYGYAGGLNMDSIEGTFAISNQTLEYVREVHVKAIYTKRRNDSFSFAPQRERSVVRDADHMAVRLLLKRFCNHQLIKIRFQHVTALKTLALILERQTNIKELELGDLGPLQDIGYEIPPTLFAPGQLKLASLQVGDISRDGAAAFLNLIHLNSSTLRSLRIGDPKHHMQSRFGPWTERSWTLDGSHVEAELSELVPFTQITLPALERLHIVHDRKFKGSTYFLIKLLQGCTKLRQLRLSGCRTPNVLLVRLLKTGSKAIKSIQICYCDSRLSPDREGPMVSLNSIHPFDILLPHTVQLTTFLHPAENYPDWIEPSAVKRLWLGCQFRCPILRSPESGYNVPQTGWECIPTKKLFDHLKKPAESISRYSMIPENWPILEELAILNPGWDVLPTIPTLKILRLTQNSLPPNEMSPDLNQAHAYLDRLYEFSISRFNRPPALRILVLDKDGFCNYTEACNQDAVEDPFLFAVSFKPDGGASTAAFDADSYRASAKMITEEEALRLCRQVGCSSYLTLSGRPSPERFWDDT